MQVIKLVGIAAIILIAAFFGYQKLTSPSVNSQTPLTSNSTSTENEIADSSGELAAESLAEQANTELTSLKPTDEPAVVSTSVALDPNDANNDGANSPSSYPPLAPYEIGNEPLSDEAFEELVNRLNNDPDLLSALIYEMQAESDPERAQYLVRILGATRNEALVPAAEQMITSGVPGSRDSGLNLLSRIAPNNPDALVVASNLLLSETEPTVLMAAINVIAQPNDASPEIREAMVSQVTSLTTHESASLRGLSISTLARLSDDPNVSQVFYNALFDSEPSVRSAGVYALANVGDHSPDQSQKLLDMIEDDTENADVRRAAIFTLSSHTNDELVKARIEAADLEIRREIRRNRQNGN